MVGTIAQLIALACHGNAFLRGSPAPTPLFPDHSTCQFCASVSFVKNSTSWLGKPKQEVLARTPDEWFRVLESGGARGIRLVHKPAHGAPLADHLSAGFVGGGGHSMLAVRHAERTDLWRASWEVVDRNAADRRIWRVTYDVVAVEPPSQAPVGDCESARTELKSVLLRIHALAQSNDLALFARSFQNALAALDDTSVRHGYHADLFVADTVSPLARSLLDACQSAWVFGGMGSWNDVGVKESAQEEYGAVSPRLYAAIFDAICAAANDSDRSTH